MFTEEETTHMRHELAANAAQSVLRLITLHDKHIKSEVSARRQLMNYCNCSYTTASAWLKTGFQPIYVDRVLEFMAAYPCVVSRHQLAPRDREALIWLRHARGIREGMGRAA